VEAVTAPALKLPSTRVPRRGTEAQGKQRTCCWMPSLVAVDDVCVFFSTVCVCD
jgi:hypothetical protein